jgi:hypothetical protein
MPLSEQPDRARYVLCHTCAYMRLKLVRLTEISTQSVGFNEGLVGRRELTPEVSRLPPSFESGQEICPTPPPPPISGFLGDTISPELPPSPPELGSSNGNNSPPLGEASSESGLGDQDDELLDRPGTPPGPDENPDSGSDDVPSSDSEVNDTLPSDSDEEDRPITREDLKTNMEFVQMLEDATLGSQFRPNELREFLEPRQLSSSLFEDPDLLLSVSNFVATLNASEHIYDSTRHNIQRRSPEVNMLSYDQVKRRVSNLSGVVTWQHDMCVDSCVGFTGPYERLEKCPKCDKPRYDPVKFAKSKGKKKVPLKSFTTFPVGPQLQARWKSPGMAQKMRYRRKKTQDILRDRDLGANLVWDDILTGSDYLEAVDDGTIKDTDLVLMLSIDGAQLLRNKKSDAWIYIWILLDLAPDERYKIRNILPGGIIPGPGKPKDLDSYLFPGLAHVCALQKEGLPIWDGYSCEKFLAFLFLLLVLADAVAMAELTASVGHHGKRGCRLLCDFPGRNKPGGSHYYPALFRPTDLDEDHSDHSDIDVHDVSIVDTDKYKRDLHWVLRSSTNVEYNQRRLETGLRKATIFQSLPRILEIPTCFPGDIMHQPVINLTALIFDLWCDRKACRKGLEGTWDWAVLKGSAWKRHGKEVEDAAPWFPRSFDRTPRNPAEKLSSGYKAWELLLYFYGLGPGLFYRRLPEKYFRHYCKLVVGIRTFYQRQITQHQLELAHKSLLEWVVEFEHLYYERKTERLHFVRQCVHSLIHLGPETVRLGPPSLSAQWTMERVIGVFGALLRQPSNLFSNLREQARKVAEINAVVAMWPEIEHQRNEPHGSLNLGQGYLLLRPKDTKPYKLSDDERNAISTFYASLPSPEQTERRFIYRWGRLQIPTGQVARSWWKEVDRSSKVARTDRNIKVCDLTSLNSKL